jgi:hypothetical protein
MIDPIRIRPSIRYDTQAAVAGRAVSIGLNEGVTNDYRRYQRIYFLLSFLEGADDLGTEPQFGARMADRLGHTSIE